MSRTAIKGLFVAIVTILFGAVLIPSFRYFSMSQAQRSAMPADQLAKLRKGALNLGLDLQGGAHLVYEVDLKDLPETGKADAVDRAIEIIRNRIDQLGVAEPVVQRQGQDRILVQLPGVLDTERAKDIVGRTARLEFKIVKTDAETQGLGARLDAFLAARRPPAANDSTGAAARPFTSLIRGGYPGMLFVENEDIPKVDQLLAEARTAIPANTSLCWAREVSDVSGKPGRFLYVLDARVDLNGGHLQNAQYAVGVDPANPSGPGCRLFMTKEGGAIFYRLTKANVNRQMAIVMDNAVYSAPRINDAIKGGEAVITGIRADTEAKDLAVVLRAGALPATITIAEERTVGPSLGRDSIRQGMMAGWIGTAAVILFMLIYYQGSGVIAIIALVLNITYLMAAMVLLKASLTLPGLAGIILTIGMAVDANILVFERIREELRAGKSVRSAIDQGFGRAFVTIFDAQATTIITAVILMIVGTGPVKGFGLTLTIGILFNLFTAVYVSRVMFDSITERFDVKRLSI